MFWYVYEHYDKSGKLFYVGKGKDRRAWSKAGRSTEWLDIANDGYSVHIHRANLDESDALALEHRLIKLHRDVLVNKMSGGGPLTPKKPINYNPPPKREVKKETPYDKINVIKQLLLMSVRNRRNPRTAVKQAGHSLIRKTADRFEKSLVQKTMSQLIREL